MSFGQIQNYHLAKHEMSFGKVSLGRNIEAPNMQINVNKRPEAALKKSLSNKIIELFFAFISCLGSAVTISPVVDAPDADPRER